MGGGGGGWCFFFFFFNDTATTEIYTLSLHDALPIWPCITTGKGAHSATGTPVLASVLAISREDPNRLLNQPNPLFDDLSFFDLPKNSPTPRSEEHTSELQSPDHLVCRLLLEKKKKKKHADVLPTLVNSHVIQITRYKY